MKLVRLRAIKPNGLVLAATFVIVLFLVAGRFMKMLPIFVVAVYIAQLTLVSVSAWNAIGKLRTALIAYAIFGWMFVFILVSSPSPEANVANFFTAGILMSVGCGIAAGMLLPPKRN